MSQLSVERVPGDTDIAAVGSLVADRGRCRMLLALGDGRALPASRLASEAGVSPATRRRVITGPGTGTRSTTR